MSTILDTIAEHNRALVEEKKQKRPLSEVRRQAEELARQQSFEDTGTAAFPFRAALAAPGMSFICEVKKASPSKGLIAPDFPYVEIAREYEAAGASAISCLTEPKWFLGRDEYLAEIVQNVSLPVLRKDFTIDEYMIYEAKCLGASAVLLICSLLTPAQIRDWRMLAEDLGMDALVEAHDEAEVEQAVSGGARIIGVNNRDLADFSVDVHHAGNLRDLVPEEVLFVSESGISCRDDVAAMKACGADAVLVGEVLMRAADKKAELDSLRGLK